MKSEKYIQTKILALLKEYGCYIVKTIKSNRNGTLDIIGCYCGSFFAIEVKKEGLGYDDATELQKKHIRDIKKAGGVAFVASSLEDVHDNLMLL